MVGVVISKVGEIKQAASLNINSIFREKNAAKQVSAGLECGITLKDFADFKEKDVIEVYKIVETERRI